MSHITKLQTKMTDVDCIKEALEEGGFTYTENGVAVAYGSQKIKGDIIAHQSGRAFDIAFVKQGDDTYSIEADWYGRGIKREDFIKQITQNYAAAKIVKEIQNDPRISMLDKEKLPNGTERIRIGVLV